MDAPNPAPSAMEYNDALGLQCIGFTEDDAVFQPGHDAAAFNIESAVGLCGRCVIGVSQHIEVFDDLVHALEFVKVIEGFQNRVFIQ